MYVKDAILAAILALLGFKIGKLDFSPHKVFVASNFIIMSRLYIEHQYSPYCFVVGIIWFNILL